MTAGKRLGLVLRNARRSGRSGIFALLGIAVGIGAFTFFLALAKGVQANVIDRVFPVGQVELTPARSTLALGNLFSGPPRIADGVAEELRALPGVQNLWRKAKLSFPARAGGGKEIFGRDIHGELIAEGLDPAAVGEPEFRDPEPLGACQTDADCTGGAYCVDATACEMPVPAVLSPFVIELYNGTIARTHGLPRLSSFLAKRMRGFSIQVELGRSFFGGVAGEQPRVRRIRLIGLSPRAAQLAVTLPLGTVQRWNKLFGKPAEDSGLLVELKAGSSSAGFFERARKLGLEPDDHGAEKAGLGVLFLTLLFGAVSATLLLLAALNIGQMFFRMVLDRRREIGLMRAVGASRRDVLGLFLGEAMVWGLGGGTTGVAFAWLAARAVDLASARYLPDFPFKPETYFSFEFWIIVSAVFLSLAASLGGALWPSREAGKLDPCEALTTPP